MKVRNILAAAFAAVSFAALAQQKEIKIGFIYDVSGPFAGGGSEPAQVGTKAALEAFLAAHPTGLYADLARAQRARKSYPRPGARSSVRSARDSGDRRETKSTLRRATSPAEGCRPSCR